MNEFIKRLLSSLVLLPTLFYVIIYNSVLFNILIFACVLLSFYEWYNMTKKTFYSYYGYILILISFYSFYKLKSEFEISLLLIILLICISTDIGGYIFGKFLKGPKLTKFSPNKTYSGLIGGYIFPIFFIFILTKLNLDILRINNFDIDFLIIVLIISTVSQVGDITISFFKRLVSIKDTGNIIPGHGGLLDRIDGMIFAFPFSYFFLINNLLNSFS